MKTTILPLVLLLATSVAFAEPLTAVKIVTDRAPDCSSLDSIVRSVTRGCETDDQRAIAIYNFCRYVYYHHAYPTEPDGVSALRMINVYGWSLCGGQHTVMAALWEKAGYRWRYVGWSRPGHSTVEVFYGGRWHYLDTFLKFYAWMPDANPPGGRTIAAQEDILTNPALLGEQFHYDQSRNVFYHRDNRFDYYGDEVNWTAPAFLVCGDTMEGVKSGVRSNKDHGSPRGWGSIHFDRPDYSTDVNLGPGYALTLDWDKTDGAFYFRNHDRGPMHTCGDKDYRNCPAIGPLLEPYAGIDPRRSWSNGTLVFEPDFRNHAFLDSLQKIQNAVWRDGALHPVAPSEAAAVVVEMASPYVIAKASFQIASEGASVEVSPDGETWTPSAADDFTSLVAGRYRYRVRITFQKPLTAIRLTSIVQHNQESLPYLAPGSNRITVTSANPAALGQNRLVVTYAYRPGARRATSEELFDRNAEIARAHSADWSAAPVVVQKTIDRFPYSFDIPVTTPKGSQPVYPRMLFIRRELLAPGQEPMSVPEPPTTPRVRAGEVLLSLPNPWTIGTQRPQPTPERPTDSVVLPVTKTAYVSLKGDVSDYRPIKWLKDNSDAWILLVDFDSARLPELARLASAHLVLYVHEAHNEAPMQAAAVALQAPFEPGASYDFAKLGQTVGWTTVARGNGPGAPFDPPKPYRIDVTRQVRAWARGTPNHGLAVRIVPNRSIDDGWTVRFTPARPKPAELLVTRYTD